MSGVEGAAVIEFSTPAVVPADPEANVTDLLVDRVTATPDRILFALPTSSGGWSDVSGADFLAQVRDLAKGFIAKGVQPGDKVGFMCKTRYEWTLVDFALWFAGAVMVPVYETSSPSQMQWILDDAEVTAMIVETPQHFARFDEVHSDLPNISRVWQLDVGDLAKLSTAGAGVTDAVLEERRTLAKESDIATLIYTSGSTGRPKGCILTHGNFVELCRNAGIAMKDVVYPGASTLLFITTAHIFARFITLLCVHTGVKVGHQPDTKQLLPSLGTFKPTFLLAVPRVFEKVYNSAEAKAEAGGKGKIFRAAADVAVEHSMALDAGSVPLGLKLKFMLFDRLVYSKLRAVLGGNVVYAVSGSAPLGHRLAHFFHSLGIRILEGYGLTETTAPISVGLTDKFKIGTVGPALPGVSVRIMDDGEILTQGINLFAGYWKNPAATAESMDGEWFRTGDIGAIDSDGFITITGRKKEILVTAGGKNVAPGVLEDPIRAHTLVGQAVVVGDRRPFIAALITLDPEMLPIWLGNNGQPTDQTLEQAAKNPAVIAEIQKVVDAANSRVSRAESVRKFEILPVEFTEASGHLTPKLSIKRAVIVEDFAPAIDRIYDQSVGTKN